MIRKPIGAKLPSCELPGGSFVNTEVVEGPDGMPDLRLMNPIAANGVRTVNVSISDLATIVAWAERD